MACGTLPGMWRVSARVERGNVQEFTITYMFRSSGVCRRGGPAAPGGTRRWELIEEEVPYLSYVCKKTKHIGQNTFDKT